MPTFHFRLSRLLVASGLLMLATFTSGKAQEPPPVDPGSLEVDHAPQPASEGFLPVSPLAVPENDYPNCLPAPGAWHPPVFYPDDTLFCPTGVTHRDWWREKTIGLNVRHRERMLEKDYAFRVKNGHQSTCCPPHSCWGHACDCCPGPGCKKSWLPWGRHSKCSGCSECGPVECGQQPCGNAGCTSGGDKTSAVDGQNSGIEQAALFAEQAAFTTEETAPALLAAQSPNLLPVNDEAAGHDSGIVLVADQQVVSEPFAGVESAGYCEVSDGRACVDGNCPQPGTGGWDGSSQGWVQGGDGDFNWEECDESWHPHHPHHCLCLICKLRCHVFGPSHRHAHLHRVLYGDGLGRDGDGDGDGSRRRFGYRGGWNREIPAWGHYYMAYPVNPYHFDPRDGRIYAAQGYGHPVGVPLAPNVQHTYNYGWGLPSSRLSPVSRMPGSPGVANPAVPGAAGPGVLPPGPGFRNPVWGGAPLMNQPN